MYKVTFKINEDDTQIQTEYFSELYQADDFVTEYVEHKVNYRVGLKIALSETYNLSDLYRQEGTLFDIRQADYVTNELS